MIKLQPVATSGPLCKFNIAEVTHSSAGYEVQRNRQVAPESALTSNEGFNFNPQEGHGDTQAFLKHVPSPHPGEFLYELEIINNLQEGSVMTEVAFMRSINDAPGLVIRYVATPSTDIKICVPVASARAGGVTTIQMRG